MKWGKKYGTGAKWGLGGASGDTLCELAKTRVWSWTPKDGNTVKFICAASAVQNGLFIDTLNGVRDAFDMETATADRLDKIGAVIGLPRNGYSDDRYRLFLQIQALIILARTDTDQARPGSHEGLLRIARTFIGSGVVSPIVLINTWPFGFVMTVPGVTIGEAQQLAQFLGRAVDAGVYGLILFTTSADSLWASRSVAVTNGGTWGSRSVVIAGAATWGYAIPVGAP